MTVYPELAFQLMILRNYMDEIIRPSRANQRCAIGGQLNSARYCGAATFKAKYSRQLWNWMAQLLVVSLKFDQIRVWDSDPLPVDKVYCINKQLHLIAMSEVNWDSYVEISKFGYFLSDLSFCLPLRHSVSLS